jgi:hypothetical protein
MPPPCSWPFLALAGVGVLGFCFSSPSSTTTSSSIWSPQSRAHALDPGTLAGSATGAARPAPASSTAAARRRRPDWYPPSCAYRLDANSRSPTRLHETIAVARARRRECGGRRSQPSRLPVFASRLRPCRLVDLARWQAPPLLRLRPWFPH